jgi:hypothetical protein
MSVHERRSTPSMLTAVPWADLAAAAAAAAGAGTCCSQITRHVHSDYLRVWSNIMCTIRVVMAVQWPGETCPTTWVTPTCSQSHPILSLKPFMA